MLAEIALVVLSSLGAGFLPEVSPELTAAVEEAVEAQGRPFDIVHIEDTMPLGDDLLAVLTFGRERGDGLHFYFMLMDSQTFKLALVVDYLSTQRETPGGHTQYLLFGFDRAVPTSITLARREEMYGIPQGKVKYFIDLEQGKVLTKQEPPHFIVDAVAVGEGAVYCAGRLPRVPEPERADDWYRQHIMVVPNPAPGEYGTPVFVSEIGGKEIPCLTHTGEPGANDVAFEGPETRCDLREGAWRLVDATPDPDPVPIGPFTMAGSARRKAISAMVDESALLSLNEPEDSSLLVVNHAPSAPTLGTHLDSGIGVADAEGCGYYPIPVPDYALFEKHRRDATERGDSSPYHLENAIGGYQVVGDDVVFGTLFSDGEGSCGIGAIGWFGVRERAYRFEYPPALSRWSTSALLAEGPYLWLGLYWRPEGTDFSGGLLRYDTRDESTTVYDVPYVIVSIVKNGDDLLMATQDGLYILTGGQILRANYTVTSDGEPATYLDRLR